MQLTFTTGDTAAALSIMREAAQWQIDLGNKLWGIETITRERLNNPAEEFLVAWLGDESVSCCLLSYEDRLFWPDVPAGSSGFVHKLAVRRRFAGQGIAAALMRHAETLCLARGVDMMRLDTDATRPKLCAFYENLGYRRVGLRVMKLPGEGMGKCQVALYEKELSL